jgi:hypothetical protein
MEQRDYLLREIEKIGTVIRAIRQKLFGGTEELAISVGNQAEILKEMLLEEGCIDLDELLPLDTSKTDEYLARHNGFNIENIELLALTLSDIGLNSEPPVSVNLLEKSLQLYEICKRRDRTYSFEREAAIKQIINALQADKPG